MDENLSIDGNSRNIAGAVTDDASQNIRRLRIDDATKGLKVMMVGGVGMGTVTSISQGTGILLTPSPITTTGSVALATSLQPIATLAGNSLKFLRVNVGETAVEYATVPVGITIGSTTITSGTTTRILYDNAGVVGEYTLTGSGTVVVMQNTPTLITPVLGVATATSINGLAITASTGTLTIANGKTVTHNATTTFAGTDGKTLTISNSGTLAGGDAFTLAIAAGKTLTASNSLTLAGTDSTVMTFPTTSATIARTDAANTFTGIQTFSTPIATGSVATMTATVGGGVPTPPNNTTTFLRGDGTFAAPSSGGGSAVTLMPNQNFYQTSNQLQNKQLNVNTTMYLGQLIVSLTIIVNKITIEATSVAVAGTLDITVYSEDGATQKIAVTTASISGAGVVTTAVSAVTLSPGIYYFAVNSNGTADVTIQQYGIGSSGVISNVTSEPKIVGTLTITAGTPPATITPTSITDAVNGDGVAVIRLDN